MLRRAWCLIGVLGFGGLAVAQAPASDVLRPEAGLPPETLLFVGTDDVEAMRAGMKGSPLAKAMGEQDVTDFLEKPIATIRKSIESAVAMARQQPALAGVDLDVDKLMTGPYGRAFLAVTHVDLPSGQPGDATPIDVGVVIGLEPRGNVDLVGLVRQVVTSAIAAGKDPNTTVDSITSGGFTYDRIKAAGAPFSLCFGKVGGLSVMSLSERAITQMAKRLGGGQPTLLASADFQRASAAVGAAAHGDMVVFAQLGKILELARHGVDLAARMSGKQGPEQQIAARIFDALNPSAFGPMLARSGWASGSNVATSYTEIDPNAKGIAALSKPRPIDRELVKNVPKEALSFSLSSFDLAPIWDMAMETLGGASPEMKAKVDAQVKGIEIMVGGADDKGEPSWSIRRDLVGALGGRMMSISLPSASSAFGKSSDTALWVETPNPAGLEKSLQLLFTVPAKMGAGLQIAFKDQMIGDVKAHVLDTSTLGPMAALGGSLQLTWAIHDGRFWFATTPKVLKKVLDYRANPPAECITAKPDFAQHFAEPPQGAVLTGLSYGDTARNFEISYGQIVGQVPTLMLLAGGKLPPDALPFDVNLLPSAESISKHLFGSVEMSYASADGRGRVSVSRSPFGAEVGVIAATVALAAVTVVGEVEKQTVLAAEQTAAAKAAAKKPKEADGPAGVAQKDLNALRQAITVFMIEEGHAPKELAELALPKPSYPNGYLPNGMKLGNDPWGHAYAYKVGANDEPMVWSFGPDGVDNGGAGDDLKPGR